MVFRPPTKSLTLRELQMAKRMLKGNKVAPCQLELSALLAAMDRNEKGERADVKMFQAALEACLQASEREKKESSAVVGMNYLAKMTRRNK